VRRQKQYILYSPRTNMLPSVLPKPANALFSDLGAIGKEHPPEWREKITNLSVWRCSCCHPDRALPARAKARSKEFGDRPCNGQIPHKQSSTSIVRPIAHAQTASRPERPRSLRKTRRRDFWDVGALAGIPAMMRAHVRDEHGVYPRYPARKNQIHSAPIWLLRTG